MTGIYIGTCSWSDHANFYPRGMPPNQRISYYSQHFPIVEINSTYYRMMPERNFQLWAERTPPGFIFDVKPFRQLTWHDRNNPPDARAVTAFSQSLQPLRDGGKLGALTLQFPPWFKYGEKNLRYLLNLRHDFPDDRVGVEFRHRSWFDGPETSPLLKALTESHTSLTIADEPQIGSGSIPAVLEVTNPDLVVFRLHGRNYKTWYSKGKTSAERFNYLYSEEELREWVPKVEELAGHAKEIHVLFNNNAQDYAVRNARDFLRLAQASPDLRKLLQMPAGSPQLTLASDDGQEREATENGLEG